MLTITNGNPVYEYVQGDTFLLRLVFRKGFDFVQSMVLNCKGIGLNVAGTPFSITDEHGNQVKGWEFQNTFSTAPTAGEYDYDITVTYTDGVVETCIYRKRLIVKEKTNK